MRRRQLQLRRGAVLGLATVLLAGCVAVGDVQTDARSKAVNPQLLSSVQGQPHGWVTVTRNSRMAFGACDVALSVRGTPVADLASGSRVRFPLPVGEHVLRAHFAKSGPCFAQVLNLKVKVDQGAEVHAVYDVHSMDGQHIFQLAY